MLGADPTVSAKAIAAKLNVSTQSVYATAKKHGLQIVSRPLGRPGKDRVWTGHFGSEKKLSSQFIGGTAEMFVCADLLRRGIPTYRAITAHSSADLVADLNGTLCRIEVKSARRNVNGTLSYSAPMPERFDILALVDRQGVVEYRPDLTVPNPYAN